MAKHEKDTCDCGVCGKPCEGCGRPADGTMEIRAFSGPDTSGGPIATKTYLLCRRCAAIAEAKLRQMAAERGGSYESTGLPPTFGVDRNSRKGGVH